MSSSSNQDPKTPPFKNSAPISHKPCPIKSQAVDDILKKLRKKRKPDESR